MSFVSFSFHLKKTFSQVENSLDEDFLEELRQHYNEGGSEGATKGIDTLQEKASNLREFGSAVLFV